MSGKEELDNAMNKLKVTNSHVPWPGGIVDCESRGTSGLGVKEGKSDFVRQTIGEMEKHNQSKAGE
ncbi:MAG: hypothetical protein C9356_19815 [Oleiphilus sp.]|nr:MAG: hypothetical protein C9356_19815 [Oleiphilus sp.]